MTQRKTEHRIPDQLCPHCGKRFDHAGSPHDTEIRPPQAGDWNVCIRCARVATFDADGRLRPLTEPELAELRELPADHEVKRLQAIILLMGAAMPWPPERPNA